MIHSKVNAHAIRYIPSPLLAPQMTSHDSTQSQHSGAWMRFFGISAGLMIPLFLVRLVMDSSVRMVYPFLPQFAAGAQLSIADYGWLISLRSWIGFLSPVMGIAADRFGQRAVMVFGLAALTLGFIGLLTLTGWWVAAPMLLLGIASSAFIPTQQAFVSDQAAFARRARALAAVDISFSLTGMLLVPLMGWMIDTIDWRAPFAALAALSALAIPVIAFRLPAGRHTRMAGEARPALRAILTRPNVVAMLMVTVLVFFGFSSFITTWSVWLNTAFAFTAADVGGVATTIGLAELGGVILGGLFIDRIGKRRGMMIGLAAAAAVTVVWVALQADLGAARIALIALGGLLEYTFIAMFPVVAEQAPEARATMFSIVSLGASIGLALGSPVAIYLFQSVGLIGVGGSMLIALIAALMLTRFQLID